jgi:predicted nuclease with TOPRIM domain
MGFDELERAEITLESLEGAVLVAVKKDSCGRETATKIIENLNQFSRFAH